MANNELLMNANEVVAFLQKPSTEFTKDDIIRFIRENEIKMVNLMYPGGDGKLKTLNFVINHLAYLDTILILWRARGRIKFVSLYTSRQQ